MSRPDVPYWPAAMPLHLAAAYCGLSPDVFKEVCPVKPISFTSRIHRYLRLRLDEWRIWIDPEDFAAGRQNIGIYFIRAGDFVKIGYSDDVAARVKMLQTASPFELEVLKIIPGTQREERQLHRDYASLHKRGEWFRLDGELAAFLGIGGDE